MCMCVCVCVCVCVISHILYICVSGYHKEERWECIRQTLCFDFQYYIRIGDPNRWKLLED
jgi:hypothetical protein